MVPCMSFGHLAQMMFGSTEEEKILLSTKLLDWYSRGYILHWNGQQWNKIELPERWNDETIYTHLTKKPKDQILLSMFVQSSQNIIVGGNVQAQWNGKEWSEIEVPRDDILIIDIEINPNGKLFAIASRADYIWDYMENKLQNCPTRGCSRPPLRTQNCSRNKGEQFCSPHSRNLRIGRSPMLIARGACAGAGFGQGSERER